MKVVKDLLMNGSGLVPFISSRGTYFSTIFDVSYKVIEIIDNYIASSVVSSSGCSELKEFINDLCNKRILLDGCREIVYEELFKFISKEARAHNEILKDISKGEATDGNVNDR